MTEAPQGSATFGANAWLVDDMYEQYLQDPTSVSESWREFFQDFRPGGANLARPSTPAARTGVPEPDGDEEEWASATNGEVPPTSRAPSASAASSASPAAPRAEAAGEVAGSGSTAASPTQNVTAARAAVPSTPGPASAPTVPSTPIPSPAPPPSPSAAQPAVAQTPAGPAPGPSAVAPAAPTPSTGPEAEPATPFRGAAARIASNMTASLGVPTATSFRVVPARLLEVNRKILNNQLSRTGSAGKVSFTHIIGYAVVQALKSVPSLNSTFVAGPQDDPKAVSAVIHHEHVALGIAVDLEKSDGSRTLMVPVIQRRRRTRLPGLLVGLRGPDPPGPLGQGRGRRPGGGDSDA